MSGGDGNSESNTGPGHNGGTTGEINGSSESGTPGRVGWSWDHTTPNTTTGPDGEVHVRFDGTSNSSSPDNTTGNGGNGGNGGGGGNRPIDPTNPNYNSQGLSVSHGHPGYWGFRLISSDNATNYYLKIFIPYGDSLASQAARASQDLLDAKQAEEAARKAAERASGKDKAAAEQAAKDAEEARVNAELEQQKQQRLAAAARLFAQDIQSVRGIPVVSEGGGSPVSFALAGLGGVSFTGTPAIALSSRIAAAIASLSEIATASLVGPVVAAVTTFFYSPSLNSGENIDIGRDVSAIIPADLMGLPDTAELEKAWHTGTPVMMPVRGALDRDANSILTVGLVRTPATGSARVAKAEKDEQTGYYSYALPDKYGIPRQTILISPADAPGVNGPTTLTGPVPLPEKVVNTGDFEGDGETPDTTILPTPWPLDNGFDDIILIFPPESGLKPIYVMFRSPRNIPGTASGKGQPQGDNWLDGAGEGEGVPVPAQVADKLRGRTFSSFDSFRRAFWIAVSQDPELAKQLNNASLGQTKLGKSTFVKKGERAGKRLKHELHHKKSIQDGGEVYDIDNIRVLTPKRHVEIHKK
ncbi:S-type pyocin domain-containing protein [Enterobacter roggenkampii]|nr:S-type pyocin domain-containing protein [Enterobacter roggenkampii]